MLLSILFGIFSFLIFYLAYFLFSGKATVFITKKQDEKNRFAQSFFSVIGILLAINGFFALFLIFYHPIWLALILLGLVCLIVLAFVFGLNYFM